METYNQIFVMCNQDATFSVTANSIEQAHEFCENEGVEGRSGLVCIAHYQLFVNVQYEVAMYLHRH